MSGMEWGEWHYSPSLKQHHRYYRGTSPYSGNSCYGAVEKAGDVYRWAVFPHGEKAVYGDADSLAHAKRDADRADATSRMETVQAELAALEAQAAQLRATRDAIRAELRKLGAGRAAALR